MTSKLWSALEPNARKERCAQELRKAFAIRFEAIECGIFMQAAHPAFYALADWVLSVDADPRAVIANLLNGFFADAWAKDRHFPLRALAATPQRYYKAPEREAPKSPELARLHALKAEREGRRDGP